MMGRAASVDTLPILGECLACSVRQLGAFDYVAGRHFHGRHRVVGVGLNRPDDRRDLLGRLAGAPLPALHPSAATVKLRPASPAEAAWMAAFRASTLVCSVISEIVRRFHRSPRGFAQALDALRGLLDLLADVVHAMDGVLHRRGPLRAASSERRATWAGFAGPLRPSDIDAAICCTVSPTLRISPDWRSAASSSCREVRCADPVALVTRVAAS